MIMDYKEVSIRYILKEKKKSILIAFSIILSVTLVTAIGTGIVSFSDMAMENIIKETGLYHTEFMGLNKNKIFLIKKNEKLGMVGSEMPSIKAETQDHTSISISGYDDNLMKMRSMMLLSGKMPEKDDDIVVSNKAAKLGDNIDLNIEGKDRKFKVTGIIRNLAVSESEGQEVPMAIITQKSAEQFINSDKFNAYVTVKSKYKIQNTIEKIKKV
jgi:putative ABC transport system permease protein